MCYKQVDQYESSALVCTQCEFSKECDSPTHGCLIKGLQSLGLYPKRATASEVEGSVTVLADALRS